MGGRPAVGTGEMGLAGRRGWRRDHGMFVLSSEADIVSEVGQARFVPEADTGQVALNLL